MILLIDAGNTRIKWALAEPVAAPGQWHACGSAPHAGLAQLAQDWRAALAGRTLAGALLSNVAGAALQEQLQAALPDTALRRFASLAQLAGLRNGYRDAAQLGCDRFAAAIGARALVPGQALIVANCGTATTIDAITADGRFLGGMILPGLGLMASSLARHTAQLPYIAERAGPPPGFADNTDDAILSGCLAAQAGAIERAHAAHGAVACIISGGAAPFIAPTLSLPHQVVDNIVLIGLHVVIKDQPC
ncbi:type III pantothenate kinase [Oxalobacteraceae bacterium GrIS 1.11]